MVTCKYLFSLKLQFLITFGIHIQGKTWTYLVFKVEGIILPTDLKGDLPKTIGILYLEKQLRDMVFVSISLLKV